MYEGPKDKQEVDYTNLIKEVYKGPLLTDSQFIKLMEPADEKKEEQPKTELDIAIENEHNS